MRNFSTVLKIAPAFLLAGTIMQAQTTDTVATPRETKIEEVVLVGYGSKKKSDLTGSITAVSEKDFNKGAIVSADQLIQGKAPGVRITNDGGAPDSKPNIRIRGGASLNASNNPLIVIDGVPLDSTNPAGLSNPLNLVNPNDIESFSILKDASSTAIYGARASNGVILITTKRGGGRPKFNFSTNVSIGEVTKYLDVMDSEEFVKFVNDYLPNEVWRLGVGGVKTTNTPGKIYDTDWQKAIYRTPVSSDNNFSATGNLFGKLPARMSLGYNRTEGVVRTNDFERFSGALRLTPSFFDKHLKVDLNLKGFRMENNAIDANGVIGAAAGMNPTQPIYGNPNYFGGYFQNVFYNSSTNIYNLTNSNPVATLMQRTRPEQINKLLGNVEFDYKFHFLPALRAVVNLGLETSKSKIEEIYADNARNSILLGTYNSLNNLVYNPGLNFAENQTMKNKNMDAYLVYQKKVNSFLTNFLIQGGYSYQDFQYEGDKKQFKADPAGTGVRVQDIDPNNPTWGYYNHLNLQSFFGRSNVDLLDKYLFTFSLRADASSLFKGFSKQWGYFPAVAFAWKAKSESFLREVDAISDLKFRFGWGKTGQQDVTSIAGFYPSRPFFSIGNPNSQYLPGFNIYSAQQFNNDLGWETTTSWNAGVDFAFSPSKLVSGTFDIYDRKTTDLLAYVPAAPGQTLSNNIISNVGSMRNRGAEISLNINPVKNENLDWNIFGNAAYNIGKVEDLKGQEWIPGGGGIPYGTGVQIARHVVGEQPYTAWVFEQVYDANGNPIVDAFVDRNNDGVLNNSDRYNAQLTPNWTYGFGTSLNKGNWDFTANFRGQIGGQVYNGRRVAQGYISQAIPADGYHINNLLNFYNGVSNFNMTEPTDNNVFSDYYLEDATFLRMDNVTLGYRIPNIFNNASSLRVYGSVNNAFIITKYSGVDPENFSSIDSNLYPRPRVYTIGFNLNF